MVASVLLVFRRKFANCSWYPLFFLPFFSDLPSENLLWAGQAQFHFMLLFSMLALHFGFNKESSWRNVLLFSLFLILSTYSMSPLLPALILFMWICRQILCFLREDDPWLRNQILRFGIIASLLSVTGILLFFVNYTGTEPCGLSPLRFHFWECMRFSLSRIFSLTRTEMNTKELYSICLLSMIPAIFFLYALFLSRKRLLLDNAPALTLVIWAVVFSAVVIYSRATSIADRHVEVVLPVIPAVATILCQLQKSRIRQIALCSFLISLLTALCWSWSFEKAERERNARLAGKEMLFKWRETQKSPLIITEVYIREFTDQAKRSLRLNLSFWNEP